jgi:hypothetical protein
VRGFEASAKGLSLRRSSEYFSISYCGPAGSETPLTGLLQKFRPKKTKAIILFWMMAGNLCYCFG